MSHLPRITGSEALGALQRSGWQPVRQRGSHVILRHSERAGRVVIPVHAGATLKPKTLLSIIESAGLSIEDLRSLL